jgi:beta-lactamase regulating signal transducer with metallopeptidase domain
MVTQVARAEFTFPGTWAIAVFALWICCGVLAAAPMLAGFWNLRRLRNSATALARTTMHPVLQETLAQCDAVRPVTVCSSSAVKVPTAIGFFKPVILIPEWALRDLPVEELKIILLHEFAHLRRWDDWTNLAQKIVRALFFFHPAVWWIEKRLSLEREMACDDAVLAKTRDPRAYAECLVSLAEKSFIQRGLIMAQAAISRASETSIRLARILDPSRSHASLASKSALGLMTVLAGSCLMLLPNAPRLIAFENSVPARSFAVASAVPQTEARVVPVTMRSGIEPSVGSPVRKTLATPAVYRSLEHRSVPRLADAMPNLHRSPVPVRTSVKHSLAPEFVVVMQSTEFNDRGSLVWSVQVWRVTLIIPNQDAVHEGVIASKI